MRSRATSTPVDRQSALDGLVDELGPWSDGPGPLYRQLARAIAHGIDRGALPGGERLPAERSLAAAVAVSRGTAVAAYDLLVADERVERRPGSGTFVIGVGLDEPPSGREGTALVHRLVDASAVGRHAGPDLIDLSLSVLHDASAIGRFSLTDEDLTSLDPASGYSPWGLADLREAIAAHVSGWGLATDANQIVVTSGAQQAIAVAAACWVRPGDTVVVDDPTYPGAVAAFTQAGARLLGVPVDRHGIDPDALADALTAHPALVYLQPTVHSPTGITTADLRRRRIAEIVAAARVPLVEDLALTDLVWGRPPPPISALEATASGMVVGSLGKRFWGGLRLGFIRAAEPLALRAARIKATGDLGTSAVSQVLGARLLRTAGPADRAALTDELHRRYEVLANALAEHLPWWTWPTPGGGLSIWVQMPDTDAATFARRALAAGVVVAGPGPLCVSAPGTDHIRLSFAAPPDEIEEAVRRLASAWHHPEERVAERSRRRCDRTT